MSLAYYNEIDPYAAQWLRNLISEGHIAPGDVDERSIEDVTPTDLRGYKQCHFFAGIGIWSYALRKAGWGDDKEVWTGSCPCQPFSAAGKGDGFDDERHLWPSFHYLIEQCRPSVVFGEQVASKDGLTWLDLVQADLEGANYSSAAVDLCAAGVGAPNIRQRLYWVAYASGERLSGGRFDNGSHQSIERGKKEVWAQSAVEFEISSKTCGFWKDANWLPFIDGKWRCVEPGAFPLVNGDSERMGRLRAYGNALNAEVASSFISSYLECKPK